MFIEKSSLRLYSDKLLPLIVIIERAWETAVSLDNAIFIHLYSKDFLSYSNVLKSGIAFMLFAYATWVLVSDCSTMRSKLIVGILLFENNVIVNPGLQYDKNVLWISEISVILIKSSIYGSIMLE